MVTSRDLSSVKLTRFDDEQKNNQGSKVKTDSVELEETCYECDE